MESPRVRIRPFQPRDIADCLSVFDANVPQDFVPGERPEFEAFLRKPSGPYFTVTLDDSVIACGGYGFDAPGVVSLCWGMVHPDFQRRRIGSLLLLTRIASIAADPEMRCIKLVASQRALSFFRRLGFDMTSTKADGIAPGLDLCRFRLNLDRSVRATLDTKLQIARHSVRLEKRADGVADYPG